MLELLVLIFVVVFSLVLSLAIYANNPKSITNRAFILAGSAIIFWSTIMYLSLQVKGYDLTLFVIRFSMLAGAVLSASFLFLASVFPDDVLSYPKKKIFFAAIPTVITMVVAMTKYMFTSLKITGDNIEPIPGPGMAFFLLAGVGYVLLTFVLFIRIFLRSTGKKRNQAGFVLLGTVLMFFFLLVANFIAVVVFKTSSFIFLAPLFPLFFLGSVGYAILRHDLLDLRLIVARTVSYSLLLIVVGALYAFGLFGLVSLLPSSVDQRIILLCVAIVIGFTFGHIRRFIEKSTDKLLFKGSYNTEELLNKLTHHMAEELHIDDLASKLLTTLVTNMRLTKAAFILIEHNTPQSILSLGFDNHAILAEAGLWSKIKFSKKESRVYEDEKNPAIKSELARLKIAAVFLMKVKSKKLGLLVVGLKASGDILNSQDLNLLDIFVPQAAIALQNAQSYRRIQQFSRTLEKKVDERTKELKETQKRELKKAKELLKIKDEFVFIATHDLGTPVTAIKGYSNLLLNSKEKFSTDTKENIDAISDASDRLNQLTNDLLQVARSDAGTIKINPEDFDLIEAIEMGIAEIKPRAADRKIKIEFKPHARKVMVSTDHEKMHEVLENLLSNAVKYNREKGSILVQTKKLGKMIEVAVADTGIGIPAEKQKQVFNKFFRAQQNGAESVPGTGLGLFVVKMLVEKMGGEIQFKSKENEGTTFTFTVPAAN